MTLLRLVLAMLWLAQPGLAQSSAADAAERAAADLRAAADRLPQAQSGTDRVAALTRTVRAYEDGLLALRDGLRRAAIARDQLSADLEAQRGETESLLAALQAMSRAPAPLLMLHPSGPLGTARGGMITSDVTPALQAKVDALASQLDELARLEALQATAAETLEDGLRGAQQARAALSAAIAERVDLPQRFEQDPVQTALLLASTQTLDAFATGLSETFLAKSDAPGGAQPGNSLPLPVQGTVLRGFNAADAAGVVRPGVIIAARPQAIVTTPVPATLLFRGPLLDYGNVAILEPAADVLFIFAGLSEVYGTAGEVLPTGSPVGLMGGTTPSADAILSETPAAAANQTLYLEVREGQSPVNPANWFALE